MRSLGPDLRSVTSVVHAVRGSFSVSHPSHTPARPHTDAPISLVLRLDLIVGGRLMLVLASSYISISSHRRQRAHLVLRRALWQQVDRDLVARV